MVVAAAPPAAADDITDAQARLQVINRLKGTLKDNLQKAQAQEIALQQQLQETQDTINQTMDKIAATERRIADLESQIEALDAKIAQEQLELRRTKDEYASFARSVYKSQSDPLAQLLGAPDFQGFLNRAVAIEHLTYLSSRLIGYIHQVDQQLHEQQDAVKAKKQEADKQRADLVNQKAALVQQQAHEQDLQKKLQQSIVQVKYEIKVIDTQSTALAQRIADMEIARQDQLIAEAEQAA